MGTIARMLELIRNLHSIRPRHQGCIVTIGNFDGVHRGHQMLLQQLQAHALSKQEKHLVVLFEPQPNEFFAPDKAPARFTRLREKIINLDLYGVDYVLCLRFNQQFAQWSADEFVQRVLVDGLKVQHLVIGDDFRFGKQRQGDFQTLLAAGMQHGFEVENRHTFLLRGERVSSTRIRQALQQGDMQLAHELLGRPYTIYGRVEYGQQLGRTIGFQTANIALHRLHSPIEGVFAVFLHGLDEQPLKGIANLGRRPTVGGEHLLLEVHLFDFSREIYGQHVEIEFISKIRDEQRFDSLDALKQQIQRDVEQAKIALQQATLKML